ncbi:mor transcription activator family protein [Haemophilus influenzae]|uniref:Mor transcription activator family protein n=2 Tax=Haemophilus influenzae TaxID=727 RepID=A0A2S9S5M1_HAEIF|nr:Mor transcription activator family protein [Haemophilus influenzae]AXP38833.1 mor transcription activator family protein [Haemophilus influenzae]KAI98177.1 mor transcription activator family protein [Haemophilus influenzae]KAI98987.1 mor transcription activator family protein [Haemophilus influenzae]KAJ00668.1 mor transcription activator family protein [Haemophilus influenzae]MBZ5690592.1 mor transcription activator family protein [Haemophilus influenzae]
MQSKLESVANYLPEIVLEMVELVGFVDVEKIINQFGGATFRFTDGSVYFPRLKALIGLESAVKLRHYFQAEEVYIPRCEVALRLLRNERLKADFDYITQTEKKSGRTAMLELCQKYRLSDRQAWEIVRTQQTPQYQQAALF